MLDQTSPQPVNYDSSVTLDPAQEQHHGETILTVLWRFKWLLAAFVAIGTSIGYWMYKQKPTTYRATTQLMFKSDTPISLDSNTGIVRGGIPSGKLMQSLITSDAIVRRVAANPELKSIPSLESSTETQIVSLVRSGIRFQTLTDQSDSRDRMIAALNFDGRDPQVCVATVNAVSQAISQHFERERQSTINEVGELVRNAMDKLIREQKDLESEYLTFRDNADLEWNVEGQAINPYRERQFQLQSYRTELEQKKRELNSDLRLAINTRKLHSDPVLVAQIIGHLGSVVNEFEPLRQIVGPGNAAPDDLTLKKLEVERTLIPLQIKRDQLELAYGASHPEVKSIAMQIESSQNKLNELNQQMSERIAELRAQSQRTDYDKEAREARDERARMAVDAYIRGLEAQLTVLAQDMSDIDLQIEQQKDEADKLKIVEERDASFNRRIETMRGLETQLEQQLAALNLADVKGGILVEPLLDTGQAYETGPDLKKDLVLFGMLGLGLSGLLAMIFESTAKMFRSAEEIQRELRLPVLTHIPLDEGRIQQGKGLVDSEIAKLDPKLSVVHRPYSPAAEAVRGVRTAMLFDRRQYNSKVFQITSPLPGDGKSTLAANVGCSVAQSGKRTLLIDLDLRSPRLSLRFNLEAKTGLTNVLNGELGPAEAIHQSPIENLDILPCGPLPANPAEALTLAELAEVFQWARENYDFVIVDTPPLLMVSDPAVVTTYVDAAMLVMRIRRRCKPNAKEAISMLRAAGARVMGVVVNEIDDVSGGASYKSSASGSYQSIGYGYGDKYRRRYQQEAKTQDTYVVKGKHASDPVSVPAAPAESGHQPGTYEQEIADPEFTDSEFADRKITSPDAAPFAPKVVPERRRTNVRS
ncbi:polysaccharide biosynthesis tyrosine autokinase [Planctomycetes bacterium TBK1r]|uniref:non-specific protein-tyrosine kinase n=1 Tax=Stieleria magnilauensis TaxID=2527963 RepID=A0ABX5XLW5_9BACT|nr:Putative tyrosine-protein kinase in cps region [Planctomycetes bacterium TBK1r]